MANIPSVSSHLPAPGDLRAWGLSWPNLANGDIGIGRDVIDFADRSVQVEGNFGVGGNLALEGTNDGTNWRVLHDPLGVALNISAPGIIQVSETVAQMRPRVTAGDGSTLLSVSLFARRTH